jgi:hypothetical protein
MYGFKYRLKRILYARKMRKRRANPPSKMENYVLDICKTLMRDRESEFYSLPISGDCHIHNEEKHVDISIKGDIVEITNGAYHYAINVKAYIADDLRKFHNRIVECRMRAMEKNKGRNINASLGKILDHVSQGSESTLSSACVAM